MPFPGKGRADYYAPGDWNAECYECGRKRKASTLLKHWQGYYVCPEHWEIRQPQDFVRSIPDVQTPPWTQPMPAWIFGDFPDVIVTEAYVPSDDLFAASMQYAITTEAGSPLLTE